MSVLRGTDFHCANTACQPTNASTAISITTKINPPASQDKRFFLEEGVSVEGACMKKGKDPNKK